MGNQLMSMSLYGKYGIKMGRADILRNINMIQHKDTGHSRTQEYSPARQDHTI